MKMNMMSQDSNSNEYMKVNYTTNEDMPTDHKMETEDLIIDGNNEDRDPMRISSSSSARESMDLNPGESKTKGV